MAGPCVTLWIGPRLGPFEQACLLSALRAGHSVALYCYSKPDGVPRGVEVRDASAILPERAVVRHRTGSPSLFSNWFRYELMRRELGTWIDCDAYLLDHLPSVEPYMMGREGPGVISTGVLRLPADSPLLGPLIEVFSERKVPRWLPLRAKFAARWRLHRDGRTGLSHMPWGSAGPLALTALAREHGLDYLALPAEVLFPVHWREADWIFREDRRLEEMIGPATVSVHLWANCLRSMEHPPPAPGSFAARLVNEAQSAQQTVVSPGACAPPLSVVMPVHNGLPFLDEAIASVLNQSFSDFEMVIADDGSTDGTGERLRYWAAQDRRIRLARRGHPSGAVGSASWAASLARAPIVARMDADDIAHPDRLLRQYEALRRQPDIALLGTLGESMDHRGRRIRAADYSRIYSAPFPPFAHSSVMYRRDAFERVGGYRVGTELWEDLDLFLRIAEQGRVAVIAEPLMRFRHSSVSVRLRETTQAFELAMGRMYRCVDLYRRGLDYTPLLNGPAEWSDSDGLPPMAGVATNYQRAWCAERPKELRRLLKRMDWRCDLSSCRALAWLTFAKVSPRGLRALLRMLLALRNTAARPRLEGHVIDWQPQSARTRATLAIRPPPR